MVVQFPARKTVFIHSTESRLALGPTRAHIWWLPEALSLGVKQKCRSCPFSSSCAEVKNKWNYTSAPPYAFISWCLIKYKDDFTFYDNSLWHVSKSKLLWRLRFLLCCPAYELCPFKLARWAGFISSICCKTRLLALVSLPVLLTCFYFKTQMYIFPVYSNRLHFLLRFYINACLVSNIFA
jgi:hypothetical protein